LLKSIHKNEVKITKQRNELEFEKQTSSPHEPVLSLKGLRPTTGLRNNRNTNHPKTILVISFLLTKQSSNL
jgi:hypothetical protein